jgi:hypothetical protein
MRFLPFPCGPCDPWLNSRKDKPRNTLNTRNEGGRGAQSLKGKCGRRTEAGGRQGARRRQKTERILNFKFEISLFRVVRVIRG